MSEEQVALAIPAEEMAECKRTARRWQAEQQAVVVRRARAWELAREAAALLKRDYGVTEITVFGSLVDPDRFSQWSDVDLAAWGLTSVNWLKAIMAVLRLSAEIELNRPISTRRID